MNRPGLCLRKVRQRKSATFTNQQFNKCVRGTHVMVNVAPMRKWKTRCAGLGEASRKGVACQTIIPVPRESIPRKLRLAKAAKIEYWATTAFSRGWAKAVWARSGKPSSCSPSSARSL